MSIFMGRRTQTAVQERSLSVFHAYFKMPADRDTEQLDQRLETVGSLVLAAGLIRTSY
jgi:hypothetical protein